MKRDKLIVSLTVRYSLVLGILTLLAIGDYIIGKYQSHLNESSSELINISGRQRMLSQRAALIAENLFNEKDSEVRMAYRRDLKTIIKNMEEAHKRLISEGPDSLYRGNLSPELRHLYFGSQTPIDSTLKWYLSLLQELADTADNDLTNATQLVQGIVATAVEGDLLKGLDKAVNQQQVESEARLQQMIIQEKLGLLLTLIVLAYSFWRIFRPMSIRLKNELHAMHELQEHLEQRVEEKTRAVHQLASAVQASAESIIITDPDANIQFANQACQKLNGYTLEELIGQNARIFHSDLTPTDIYRDLWNTIHDKKTWSGEIVNKRSDRTEYDAHLTIAPILNENEDLEGFVGIQSDITKIKEYERKLKLANQSLEKLARTDALTCVPNRYGFDNALDNEWRRARRDKTTLSLVMLDVDYFKNYNDSFGHQKGDECLKKIADSIKNIVGRPGDLVARYGGEEFAVVMPETETSGAGEIAEEIRLGVESLQLAAAPGVPNKWVTVSLGVASFQPDRIKGGPEVLVTHADKALYRAKEEGRNRVCMARTN